MWFKFGVSTLLLVVIISGVPNTTAKLVCYDDGSTANNTNKYPFLVSVRVDGVHKCTGTIIKSTWILTAASCIGANVSGNRVSIQYGLPNFSRNRDNVAEIKNRVRPTLWHVSEPHRNDIILLRLQGWLPYGDNVVPVRLAGSEIDLAGKLAVLAGWTRNSTDSSVADKQIISLRVESNRDCAKQLEVSEDSLENICTKYEGAEKVYPFFPSGGPLMYDGLQVGIASYQPDADTNALPNVFTSISHYTEWIVRMMDIYDK